MISDRVIEQARANKQCVLEIVLAAGYRGISSGDVAKATGWRIETVGKWLRTLERGLRIERSHRTGQSTKWGPPGIWAHYQEERERAHRERQPKALHPEPEDVVIHRIVQATSALPVLRPRGPRSVWDLAA